MALLFGLAGIDIDPYHFACDGPLFGIPHGLNVVTNLPFLFVGGWGLAFLVRRRLLGDVRAVNWTGLWISVTVLTFGSGAYHVFLEPWALAFDRLCITGIIGFLGAEVAAVRFGWGPGYRLSLAFVLATCATVVAWTLGLTSWLYAAVQGLGGLAALGLLVDARRRGRIDGVVLRSFLGFAAFYAVAKVVEVLDAPICDLTGVIGGHPLKHLLSACGLLCLRGWMRAATRPGGRAAAG